MIKTVRILPCVTFAILIASGHVYTQDTPRPATPAPAQNPVVSGQNPAVVQNPPVQNPPVPVQNPPVVANSTDGDRALKDIRDRLDAIDAAVAKLSNQKTDYTPALLTLFGTLVGVAVGSVVSFLTQRKLLAHQKALADDAAENAKELAADRAKLEMGNSFVQWQLKQLSELYGPLHALFRQSHVLYRHMNTVLAKADSSRFRFREDPQTDRYDGKVFEIKLSEGWVRFRTILHMDQVYGRGYGVDDYFNGVVSIGARIVKVIEEKAGYVLPDQAERLGSLFGQYLAHYAVLERLSAYLQKQQKRQPEKTSGEVTTEEPMTTDESAVFPAEIQGVIHAGFTAITKDLNSWRHRASS